MPLALAADQTVTATASNEFIDANVTVTVGNTVTWNNAGGFHNVKFDDNSFEQPADPQSNNWTVSRTFNSAGTFRYYCELHGDVNGVGMAGAVTVNPSGTAPSPGSPGGTTPPPAPSPPVGTDVPRTPAPDTTGAVISRFSMTRTRFRVRRGRSGGSAFRFQLSEPASVRILVARLLPGRRVGQTCRKPSPRNRGRRRCTRSIALATVVRPNRRAGTNMVSFNGRIGARTLRPGRYLATISATDTAGNRSRPKRRSFQIFGR